MAAASALPVSFAKLGLHGPADLILHLPLRYEDETRLTTIAEALPGRAIQVQGVVTHCEAQYKPRRALIARIRDDSGAELDLRFINFYGSQVKQFSEGNLIRALGEVRGGFLDWRWCIPVTAQSVRKHYCRTVSLRFTRRLQGWRKRCSANISVPRWRSRI